MSDKADDRPCPYVTGNVTKYCTLTPLTLTDAEREAIEDAIGWIESPSVEDEAMPEDYLPITATLRGLLERCSQFAKRESDRPQPIADARLAARLAALQQLAELDEELGLPRCTPNPLATPGECSVPPECTDTGEAR